MADRKVGLVVSGGGSKGAFAVGALKYLIRDLGMSFDMVAGSSTGSLIAPMVIADRLDVIVDIYSNVTTPEIITKKFLPFALFTDALYDVAPLYRLIDRNITPEVWQRLTGPRPTFITTVNLQTGLNTYFRAGGGAARGSRFFGSVRPDVPRETFTRAVLASCCQPIFMPPVDVEQTKPLEQHVDGGVRDVDPAQILIDHGATDLFVIDLGSERHPPERTVYTDLLSIFARGLTLFTTEITRGELESAQLQFDAVDYLGRVEAELSRALGRPREEIHRMIAAVPGNPFASVRLDRYTLIQPLDPLPITDMLDFDPRTMREVMAMGYERAREVVGQAVAG